MVPATVVLTVIPTHRGTARRHHAGDHPGSSGQQDRRLQALAAGVHPRADDGGLVALRGETELVLRPARAGRGSAYPLFPSVAVVATSWPARGPATARTVTVVVTGCRISPGSTVPVMVAGRPVMITFFPAVTSADAATTGVAAAWSGAPG